MKKRISSPLLKNNKQTTGQKFEQKALFYLQQQGLKLKEKNFSWRHGEIDLIMLDNDFIVFVEVRYRKNSQYGLAEETVSKSKQEKIKKTALYYLQQKKLNDHCCRFDIIAFNQPDNIRWIKNAFY